VYGYCAKSDFQKNGKLLAETHRIGIKGSISGAIEQKQKILAEISPKEAVDEFKSKITLAGSSNLTISNENEESNGKSFDLIGTQKSSSKGDQKLTAKINDKISSENKISVVIPSKVATPHHEPSGTALVKNVVQPGPNSLVILGTIWYQNVNIIVQDQFDETIGELYEGAEITEDGGKSIGLSGKTILTKSSSYVDPTGVMLYSTINGMPKMYSANDPAVGNWPTDTPIATSSAINNGGNKAEVDGFHLSPGIENRKAYYQGSPVPAQNTVNVIWP
jgi:hypothetical protein